MPAIPILTVLMIWANRFCKVAMAKSKGNLAAYKAVSAAATLLQPLVHGLIATLGEMSTARPASLHRLCSTVARCMPPFNPMILSAGNL